MLGPDATPSGITRGVICTHRAHCHCVLVVAPIPSVVHLVKRGDVRKVNSDIERSSFEYESTHGIPPHKHASFVL